MMVKAGLMLSFIRHQVLKVVMQTDVSVNKKVPLKKPFPAIHSAQYEIKFEWLENRPKSTVYQGKHQYVLVEISLII